MYQDNRPLETLAAFALSFVAGALSTVALSAYVAWQRKKAVESAEVGTRQG